jgi:hypothetical protein
MSLRREIENRLGIFARPAMFDNCGIGPNGFEPGNTCGKESGGGSGESKAVRGIDERAKAAGKSFTEQWLHETRSDIDRDREATLRRELKSDQRAVARSQAKADSLVKDLERKLSETKARGPQAAAPKNTETIKALETELTQIRAKQAELAEAKSKREAEQAKSDAAMKVRVEELRKKWTKMFGPKKAEDMISKTFKSRSSRPNRTNR